MERLPDGGRPDRINFIYSLNFLLLMERYVTYSIVARRKPGDKESPAKFYAQAQASGVMGTNEICDRLQRECTLTRADTMAVLVALEDVVADGLRCGEIVRLGDLCSLQLSLGSMGAASEKEFDNTMIKGPKVVFRSGATLRNAIANLVYRPVPKRSVAGADGGSEVLP